MVAETACFGQEISVSGFEINKLEESTTFSVIFYVERRTDAPKATGRGGGGAWCTFAVWLRHP